MPVPNGGNFLRSANRNSPANRLSILSPAFRLFQCTACSVGLLLLFVAPGLRADITLPEDMVRAPIPNPVKVRVSRGAVAEITLSALTSSNKDVFFILRSAPAAGKLLDASPVRKSKTETTVRYQSDPQQTAKSDSFKFAAKLEGGAVSPAQTVEITLVDPKIDLVVPGKVNFGSIRLGMEGRAELPLENKGDADYHQEVTLPAGFLWGDTKSARARVVVPAGTTVKRLLIFKPAASSTTGTEIVFQNIPPVKTRLEAEVGAPIAAASVVYLKWNPETKAREGLLRLENPTTDPVAVSLGSPDQFKLEHIKELTLQPGTSIETPVRLSSDPSLTFKGKLDLSASGMPLSVIVSADPAPSLILADGDIKDGVVDFGTVPAEAADKESRRIVLRNAGGTVTNLFGSLPVSFFVEGFSNGMSLEPGKEVPFLVKIKPGSEGRLRGTLDWRCDQQSLTFALAATVARDPSVVAVKTVPPPAGATLSGALDSTPLDEQSQEAVDSHILSSRDGLFVEDLKFDLTKPRIDAYQKAQTPDSVTLAWLPLPGENWSYIVFERAIAKVGNYPRPVWIRAKNVSFGRAEGEVTATLSNLPDNWANYVRVTGQGPDGTCSPPTPPLTAVAAVPEPVAWGKWVAYAALAALPILLWRWHKHRSAQVFRRNWAATLPTTDG